MLCLSRVLFWCQVPVVIGVALATVAVEFVLVPSDDYGYYHLFATALLFVVGLLAGYSSEYTIRSTWLHASMLHYLARLDRLTGLLNRHALEGALEQGCAHARREGCDYAIAIVDIDAFGEYNDHYGHQHGDAALEEVAQVLEQHARRPLDVCGRYGGEEFVLFWMECDAEEAFQMAEAVRAAVEQQHIAHDHSPAGPWVTVSIGVCHVAGEQAGAGLDRVLREADDQLYAAKHGGRNQARLIRYPLPPSSANAPGPSQRQAGPGRSGNPSAAWRGRSVNKPAQQEHAQYRPDERG